MTYNLDRRPDGENVDTKVTTPPDLGEYVPNPVFFILEISNSSNFGIFVVFIWQHLTQYYLNG